MDDFSADVLKRIDEAVLNYKKGIISPAIDLSDFKTGGEDSSYFREEKSGLNFNSDKIQRENTTPQCCSFPFLTDFNGVSNFIGQRPISIPSR